MDPNEFARLQRRAEHLKLAFWVLSFVVLLVAVFVGMGW